MLAKKITSGIMPESTKFDTLPQPKQRISLSEVEKITQGAGIPHGFRRKDSLCSDLPYTVILVWATPRPVCTDGM